MSRRRTDRELLSAARDDPEMFGEFYRRCHDDLTRFLHSRCRDPEVAYGIMQETMALAFVAVVVRETKVREPLPWLFQIAMRELRRWQEAQYLETPTADMLDFRATVPDGVDDFLRRDELARALAELPDEDAALVVLVDALGYPSKEVARAFGMTDGQVRVRAHRARQRLRVALS